VNDERGRLFVALELPGEIREAIVVWRERALAGVSGLRAVAAESLHVTLCFLGSLPVVEVDALWEACRAAVVRVAGSAPPSLVLGAAVWLPPRRPRVLAVSVGDGRGALAAAQALVSSALVSGGWYRPETRPFLAHVTVARVARSAAAVRALELTAPPAIEFAGTTVTLFRSWPGPGGPRYEALRSAKL
jgi:2'-5' RNA ligase